MKKIFILFIVLLFQNANAQWNYRNNINFPGYYYQDFCFFDDSTGISSNWFDAVGGGYNFFTSSLTNYGATCTFANLNYNIPCGYKLQNLTNSDTVIRTNDVYGFEISTDRGNSWTYLYTPGLTSTTECSYFLNSSYGLFVDSPAENIIRFKENSLTTMYSLPSGAYNTATYLTMLSKEKGFMIVNNHSTLITTNDSGFTWTTVLDTTIALFNHVEFAGPLVGYISCNNGIVYKTIDGGNNWNALVTGTPVKLNWSDFLNDTMGYTAGDNGIILKTIDGGGSWAIQTVPTVNHITKVQAVGMVVYCVDGSGALFISGYVNSVFEKQDRQMNFSLFPNPAKNYFTITNHEMKKINSMELFNAMGQLEYAQTIQNNNALLKIELPQLPAGIKYCRIKGEENFTYKIVVE